MSTQEQARQAFRSALNSAGRWDPVVVLGLLADKLHEHSGFSGSLDSLQDFDLLSNADASLVPTLLPELMKDLPDLSQV